jgi:mRNA-degrading endonuclease RelE of RelBE toxin-antitoxin system
MVKVLWTQKFEQEFSKVKDSATREKILKQIRKIHEKPELGKPLRYSLKGVRL